MDQGDKRTPSAMVTWLAIVRTRPTLDILGRWILGKLGLSLTDFKILESVLHEGSISPSRLGTQIGLSRGAVTSAVNRLITKGLVKREPVATDARSSHVELTPRGKKVIEAAWQSHAEIVERVLADTITSEESAVLVKLLGRVRPIDLML